MSKDDAVALKRLLQQSLNALGDPKLDLRASAAAHPMSAAIRRAAKLPYIAGLVFALLIILGWLTFHNPDSFDNLHSPSWSLQNPFTKSELGDIFLRLHKPSIAVDAISYKEAGGREWQREGDAKWAHPLGKRLCIIDLDNRSWDAKGEIWNEDPWSFDDGHGLSAGILNHYMYAQIHGYKYYYIRTTTPEDRRASWRKPPVISDILKKHDICLYLDSDAIFNHLDLPFEWLMNYWKIVPKQTSLAMALDPNSPNNRDNFGKVYLNTGFIIAQNHERTYEILDAWARCPEPESKYENCSDYMNNEPGKPTDQGAMGNYIRYDFEEREDIRELPCTEANGYPESHSGCNGYFIRHVWTSKQDMLLSGVARSMAGAMFEDQHRRFLDSKEKFLIDEKDL